MRLFQKLFPPTPEPTDDEIQQRLMEILDFKKDDLKENQYGRMSKHQHYWLVDRWLRQTLLYIGGAVAIGAILVYFGTRSLGGTYDVVWIVFLAVAVVGLAITGLMSFWDMLVDIVKRQIGVASGLGKLRIERSYSKDRAYKLCFDNEKTDVATCFYISQQLYKALVDNQYYTVYYALRSKVILAIEVD